MGSGVSVSARGMAAEPVTIQPEPFDSEDARRLIAALDAGLAERYPPDQRFGPNFKSEHAGDGRGTFLVARTGGEPVACGALRVHDAATAEVKRMYVDAARRGRGLGRAVLHALELHARGLGVRRLVLETGVHQREAIALYRGAGFTEVECWGEYAASPSSLCFEKALGDA